MGGCFLVSEVLLYPENGICETFVIHLGSRVSKVGGRKKWEAKAKATGIPRLQEKTPP